MAKIIIGNRFKFTSGDCLNSLCRNIRGCIDVRDSAVLEIGNDVGISSAAIWCSDKIIIGNNVLIGGNCIIIDTDAHSLDWKERGNRGGFDEHGRRIDGLRARTAPIIIGDDVLIGMNTIVLKGAIIGDRTVIGAGSVVTGIIPPDCIAAGNPARVIRKQK